MSLAVNLESSAKRIASSWITPFALVSIFSIISLIDLSGPLRKYFLLAGALLCFCYALIVLLRQNRADKLLLLFVVATLVFWAVAYPPAINGNDDNTAYLVFAKEFVNGVTNSIHPLSERRLFSVGASYAFQGPILFFLGAKWLSLFEPVLGLALLFILATRTSSCNPRQKLVCLIPCILISILPLAGSAYLANTSSVFVLASFSYAILLICKKSFQGSALLSSWDVIWAGLFCVYASLLRPTTAPFNVIILLAALSYSVWKTQKFTPYIISLSCVLLIFLGATHGYSQHFGTRLYPLLGRGHHITSIGFSTSDGISMLLHLRNIFAALFTDPIVLFALVAASLAIASSYSRSRLPYSLALLALILSVILISVSTGGLAVKRYLFPIAIATALFGFSDLNYGGISFLNFFSRYSPQTRVALVLAASALLLLPRLLLGDKVIAKRMLMYEPASSDALSILALKSRLQRFGPGSRVLLVSTGLERFIIAEIDADFVIMDQPGTMLPWAKSRPFVGYEEGLRRYLEDLNVRAIVARVPFNSSLELVNDESTTASRKGWGGLMELAGKQNSIALGNILQHWNKSDLGSLVLYTRN